MGIEALAYAQNSPFIHSFIRYQEEQNEFLSRIITCDETWFHHQKASGRQCSGSTCLRQAPRNSRFSHLQARSWLVFIGIVRESFLWTLCLKDTLRMQIITVQYITV